MARAQKRKPGGSARAPGSGTGRKRSRSKDPSTREGGVLIRTFRRTTGRWKAAIGAGLTAVVVAVVVAFASNMVDADRIGDGVRNRDPEQLIAGFRPGDALQTTITNIHDGNDAWTAAFDEANLSAAERFMTLTEVPGDRNGYFNAVLDAGGYAWGGMNLLLEVEGKRNQEITIFDIRVNRSTVSVPSGAVVLVYNQGGDTSQMQIDLDAAVPVPQILDDNVGPARPFFKVKRIGLAAGQKETLSIEMDTVRSAYEFTLSIDYEVGGEKFTSVVDRDGKPFRVTAIPCANASRSGGPSQSDDPLLAGVIYQRASLYAYERELQGYRMKMIDPTTVCGQ